MHRGGDGSEVEREALGLLDADERPPFLLTNPGARSPFLFVGDHAGRAVPRSLGSLGLQQAQLDRHIGWDIGVAALGRSLALAMEACFIEQRFSRLVIDCNREPSRDDSIVTVSDGSDVFGNFDLEPEARRLRREAIFDPYHGAIAAELDLRLALGLPTILVALHSFTPALSSVTQARPWTYGVLHLNDSRFSRAMIERLCAEPDGPIVGDNQPYQMDLVDYTIPAHSQARGLDYLELETRQDLLADEMAVLRVTQRLARVLPEALASLESQAP